MAAFVLVHGAFHGGWCWKKLCPLLHSRGHSVYTPTLTGLGERSHLLAPEAGLSLHVQDVVNVLEYEDLDQVILVGHSYAGMLIKGAADRAAHRIAHLVYLDAFVPESGQALREQFAPEEWSAIQARVATQGQGWRWFPSNIEQTLLEWGVSDPKDSNWMSRRLTPQPIRTATEALLLVNPHLVEQLPRTFIFCRGNHGGKPTHHQSEVKARNAPGWDYRELSSGHDAMIAAPDALANVLLDIANMRHRDLARHSSRVRHTTKRLIDWPVVSGHDGR